MFTDYTHIHVDQHEFFNRVRQYTTCFESTLLHELRRAGNKIKQHSATSLPQSYPQLYPIHALTCTLSHQNLWSPQQTDLQSGRGCSNSIGLLVHSEEAGIPRFSPVSIRVSWRSINPSSPIQSPLSSNVDTAWEQLNQI